MRLRVLLVLAAVAMLAGCTADATTPTHVVPANMTELKGALGVLPTYEPPVAKAQVNLTTPTAGAAVRFTTEGSSDPQGLPLAFAWDFGDGETGSGATVEHAYARSGEFVARLTVSNDKGLVDTAVVTLQVRDPNRAPVAVLRVTDEQGNAVTSAERGQRIVYDASGSTDDGPYNVDWSFGDGITSHEVRTGHVYSAPGRYAVKLHVLDAGGLSAYAEALMRVNALYETTGVFTISDDPTTTYEFPVAAGLTKLEVRLTFDAAFGANDLTVVIKDAGNREVGRASGETGTGAQGQQVRTVTLDADALSKHRPGTWRAVLVREAVSPAGVDWHLGVRELY